MRARKWPAMRWQAYAASALMEWRHEAKDTIPRNIFELGLKSHLGEAGLVLAYSQFLLGEGEDFLFPASLLCVYACLPVLSVCLPLQVNCMLQVQIFLTSGSITLLQMYRAG
jgi:hypothetical protein